jgi:lysine 2,3-aminomutase
MDGLDAHDCRANQTLRSVGDLVRAGLIPPAAEAALRPVADRYPLSITGAMAALIDAGDPRDPIAAQFLPQSAELLRAGDETLDPIGDQEHSPCPGVIHRYPDRLLLLPTRICAVYCRFCFRRESVGPGHRGGGDFELAAAVEYIVGHPEIWEVIVTGGDPLMLAPERLQEIIAALSALPQLGAIRIHTRVPMVAPARITPALLGALASDKALYFAIHANHPREFTPGACRALRRLSAAGIPLLGQTVLLADINDDQSTLENLMRRFVENRVKPYYLHHLDPAPGTARFRVSLERGRQLVAALRGRVSGICQPAHVLDLPGGHGKSPLGPDWLAENPPRVRDWQGQWHRLEQKPAPAELAHPVRGIDL